MENNTKARLLYVLRLLEQYSDEEHPLTTSDLISMLAEKYGISTHRITLKTDIETLQSYGVDIEVINRLPIKTMKRIYVGLCDLPLEKAVQKVGVQIIKYGKWRCLYK